MAQRRGWEVQWWDGMGALQEGEKGAGNDGKGGCGAVVRVGLSKELVDETGHRGVGGGVGGGGWGGKRCE